MTDCGRKECKNKDCDTCFEIANKIWWDNEKAVSDLSKYGEIVEFKENLDNGEFEFHIGEGFSGSMDDVLSLMELCKKIAGAKTNSIKLFKTDVNLFHLILK